jgi:radical SAM family uncharacterized protein
LYSLETFTPLDRFDAVGFSLQYELGYTNVLTMLELGRIPLEAEARNDEHPLILAGGACVFNPEPMARFFDLFLIGDGEEVLPRLFERWLTLKKSGGCREAALLEIARSFPSVYVPRFYEVAYDDAGRAGKPVPTEAGVPEQIEPAIVQDLDAFPLPEKPIVPMVETVQDRVAVEIMRGCPGRCRFCQSTSIKRPLRYRSVESIVRSCENACRFSGLNEVSLLSLSTSDYPHFSELMQALGRRLTPQHIAISVPSLRVNEQLSDAMGQLNTLKHSSLTVAPEAAGDELRRRIGKRVTNEHLLEGCRTAFEKGFHRVKLYFMCGLPGETEEDLTGILRMAEAVARLGKEVRKRFPTVTVSVANFVPKPHTPFQWCGMETPEYFAQAHRTMRQALKLRPVKLKYHDLEMSLLEGLISRGDRRIGEVVLRAWKAGARCDAWSDQFEPDHWHAAIESCESAGLFDHRILVHQPYPPEAALPWSHISTFRGHEFLKREYSAACPRETGSLE